MLRFRPLNFTLSTSHVSFTVIVILVTIVTSLALAQVFRPQLKFIWHCFFRTIGADNQKARLDKVSCINSQSHLGSGLFCFIVLSRAGGDI